MEGLTRIPVKPRPRLRMLERFLWVCFSLFGLIGMGAESPNCVYYWGIGNSSAIRCEQFLFFAGEGEMRDGNLSFLSAPLPQALPKCNETIAVLRLSPSVLETTLTNGVARRKAAEALLTRHSFLSTRYDRVLGLQLDADCPERLIPAYCQFIESLKSQFGGSLSITVIGSWLQPACTRQIAQLDLPVYIMLYTLAPSREYSTWRGELPTELFHRTVSDLSELLSTQVLQPSQLTVVLPCYSQVTLFDDEGHRICRSGNDDWIAQMEQTGAIVPITPLPERLRPAAGEVRLWQVRRTGLYGAHVLRSGSTIALEIFDIDAWRAMIAMVKTVVRQPLRFGLYHLGGPGTEMDNRN